MSIRNQHDDQQEMQNRRNTYLKNICNQKRSASFDSSNFRLETVQGA
jgi:hypothetical protein